MVANGELSAHATDIFERIARFSTGQFWFAMPAVVALAVLGIFNYQRLSRVGNGGHSRNVGAYP